MLVQCLKPLARLVPDENRMTSVAIEIRFAYGDPEPIGPRFVAAVKGLAELDRLGLLSACDERHKRNGA